MSQFHPIFSSGLFDSAFDFKNISIGFLAEEIEKAYKNALKDKDQLVQPVNSATWKNTMEALEDCGQELDQVMGVIYNFFSAATNDDVQALVEKYSPLMAEYSNSITLNEGLFQRIKYLFENQQELSLDKEQTELLRKTYEDFVRNGALLPESQKKILREIDQKLSQLSPQFSKNVLESTKSFYLEVKKEDLEGLPKTCVEQAQVDARDKGLGENKYVITLDFPSMYPFMQFSKNRSLREKLYKASTHKAYKASYDNQGFVKEIIQFRGQKAKVLGFKNYAELILKNRMAETPERVFSFLTQLKEAAFPVAQKEVQVLSDFAKEKDGLEALCPWDFSYYAEWYKKEAFDFDSESLRPYFKLENVLQGAFDHAYKLYGLSFKKREDLPVYHPDVKVFEVVESHSNKYIGLLYADFFPRDSKRGGAWMTNYRDQGLWCKEVKRPHVSIVCNFTKPTSTQASLLNFIEVQTLFHEFGHSLHGLLSDCKYRSLSGTNVLWDFVELPSQIMENWTLEKEGLNVFARHFETEELIPEILVENLKRSEDFLKAYFTIRQYNLAFLDMVLHTDPPSNFDDIHELEKSILKDTLLFEHNGSVACSFAHIFAGGYAAGYYSYKWAEVLDADAFEFFKDQGIFNEDVATAFKDHILSRGGTEHPMELYKKFRGREPDVKALLRRDHLI